MYDKNDKSAQPKRERERERVNSSRRITPFNKGGWGDFTSKNFIKTAAIIFCAGFLFFGLAGKASAAGEGQYYRGNGGYGRILNANFTDLDYTQDFSVEAVIDIKPYENSSWPGIVTKLYNYGLYNASYAGWGLGLNQPSQYGATIVAKVGDGTNDAQARYHMYVGYAGRAHIIMTWNAASKTVNIYVDGVLDGTATNNSIVLANIDNSNDFWLGKSAVNLTSPIIFARLWNRDLSSDASTLYGNYNSTKQHELPLGFDTTNLVSEWLMFDESNSSGGAGTTHVKDTIGANHVEMTSGANIISSSGALSLASPADGATSQNKAVTLSASGGYDTLSGLGAVTGPLQYYFQVDEVNTFDSSNLKESSWIADVMTWQPLLKPSTTYYWRVKTRDSASTPLVSSYTATFSFTTQESTTWYVRPVGGSYGSENGTSYDNAWDGLLSVVWGESGVEAGDTLYVAGLHLHNMTSINYTANQANVLINASGLSDENPITIRGDYAGDPGVVWGAYKISYASWTSDGEGVYHVTLSGTTYGDWFFEDVTQNSYTILTRQTSLANAQANPGSFYKNGQTLYVHTTDGADPAGRIAINSYGYEFVMNPTQYIKFSNFSWYNPNWSCIYSYNQTTTRCNHITWDGLTMAYGVSNAFSFYDYYDYMEVLNSNISWFSSGIYNISTTNNAPSYYLYKGNTIHDIGVRDIQQNGDAHCIGIQGGNAGIIEDNYCYNAGSGPLLYAFTNQILTNTIIRKNYVKDLHNLGSASGYGVSSQSNNDSLSDKSGNEIYNNIVNNATVGYRMQFEDEQEVYNNVAYNCAKGFESTRNYNSTVGADVTVKNNLFLNPTTKHINWGSGATSGYTINFDHNLYFPDTGALFYKTSDGNDINFSGWQSIVKAGSAFDPNSSVADPLFTNVSGNYSNATDFQISQTSPAIDSGTDVSLTTDYASNPIYGLPDIGGYEYQPPYTVGTTPVPTSGSVRVYSDGQYRALVATSSAATISAANFSITPSGGSFYTASTSQYLDITIDSWSTSGAKNKQWTATSTDGGVGYTHATSTVYTIGDLLANTAYTFKVDSLASTTAITGYGSTVCTSGVCTSNSSGIVTFTYSGGYSTHTFALEDITAPTLTETTPVSTPSNDTTPSYVFSSSEAGTLLSAGSCTPGSTSISLGANTVTYNALADGTYTDLPTFSD
ncbi:MAG: hypothetical protein Q7R92_02015 [bacterium]|nr:hypothetical protein [bacterium]